MTFERLKKLPDSTRVVFHWPRHNDHGDEGKTVRGWRAYIQWDDGEQTDGDSKRLRYVRELK